MRISDWSSDVCSSDLLVYTSEPLEEAMEVSGFVDAVLKVSSSARDTDFAVKLVDVAPDGTARIIGDTMLRARYRDSYTQPGLMQAGPVKHHNPTTTTTSLPFVKGPRRPRESTTPHLPELSPQPHTTP